MEGGEIDARFGRNSKDEEGKLNDATKRRQGGQTHLETRLSLQALVECCLKRVGERVEGERERRGPSCDLVECGKAKEVQKKTYRVTLSRSISD